MSVEIAWKQNILVTDFQLLKSLLVVFGFGSQAFVCGFSRQNICSVSQFVYFWGKCVYFSIFEWSQHNISVNFIIQRLKNKHIFLKNIQTEKAEEPFILDRTRGNKNQIFCTLSLIILASGFVLNVFLSYYHGKLFKLFT